jgi:glycosyltransferase involved in cell wall biosynthesis
MKLLTIAIPTYNRHEIFSRNIPHVLAAVAGHQSEVEIVVVDNGSSPAYELPDAAIDSGVQLHRNPANIGLGGNLLRCIEHAQGRFVWLLGDDDPVHSSSVATILEVIRSLSGRNVFAVGFSNNHLGSDSGRGAEIVTSGVSGFLNVPHAMHWLSSISVAIYDRTKMLRELETGYTYQYGVYPHVAMTFSALLKDNSLEVHFRPEGIVEDGGLRGWDYLEIALRQPSMFELPFSREQRDKLAAAFRVYPYRPPDVIRSIYRRLDKDPALLATSRFQLDQLIRRSWNLRTFDVPGLLTLVAFRLGLHWPAVLRKGLSGLYKIAGKRNL